MPSVRFAGKTINLPGNRPLRIGLGVLFTLFGFVGFLPILGFWMVPVGLLILSADIPAIRRFNRRITVRAMRWWRRIRGKVEATA